MYNDLSIVVQHAPSSVWVLSTAAWALEARYCYRYAPLVVLRCYCGTKLPSKLVLYLAAAVTEATIAATALPSALGQSRAAAYMAAVQATLVMLHG